MSRTHEGESRQAQPRGAGPGNDRCERIKAGILNSELPPPPLVGATLAQWRGASRTPVREALRPPWQGR